MRLSYQEKLEQIIEPILVEHKNLLNTYLIKYKDDVIKVVQSIIDIGRSGVGILDENADSEEVTSEKDFSKLVGLDTIIFVFMNEYLKYKFFIDRDKECLNDLVTLNEIVTETDYRDEVSSMLDVRSEVLDYVLSKQYMILDEKLNQMILSDELYDNDLEELLQPNIVKLTNFSFYRSPNEVEQYVLSKLCIENKKDLLFSFLNIGNSKDRAYVKAKDHARSILFNYNYLSYMNNGNEVSYSCDDEWWPFLRVIVNKLNTTLSIHLKQFEKLDKFYQGQEVRDIFLTEKELPNKKCLNYMGVSFSIFEVVEILTYSHILLLTEMVIKNHHQSKDYFNEKRTVLKDSISKTCKSKGLNFETSAEINLFTCILRIKLIGDVSLIHSLKNNVPRITRNIVKVKPIIAEDVKHITCLSRLYERFYISSLKEGKKPVEILGTDEQQLFNRLVEKSISEIGSEQTTKFLKLNKFSDYFWKELQEFALLDNLIPENKVKNKIIKF